MSDLRETRNKILSGGFDSRLSRIYKEDIIGARERLAHLAALFEESFGCAAEPRFFSAPGRTEICGNHTDHNRGCVLAAALNLDAAACAAKTDGNVINLYSEGFEPDSVSLDDLTPDAAQAGKSGALIKGVAAGLKKMGYRTGGFNCVSSSRVLRGSGMSSSAAFEVLVGTVISCLYNDGKIPAVEIAKAAQYAENNFFFKPCGLMDQTACASGGFVKIDFADPETPAVTPLAFDFSACGHALCITDTKGDHAGLTDEYAAIRAEMEAAAHFFGKSCLRELSLEDILLNAAELRNSLGERPVLRAIHFFKENERVENAAKALADGDFEEFKRLIISSGRSSFMYNQNIYSVSKKDRNGNIAQPAALALAVSDALLEGKGAWRVHGGGFAGTIQAFVPFELLEKYTAAMDALFGKGSCRALSVRPQGGTEI